MQTVSELLAEAETLRAAGRTLEAYQLEQRARWLRKQMLRVAAAFENWSTTLEDLERKSDDADG